jgi:hypothetical protein
MCQVALGLGPAARFASAQQSAVPHAFGCAASATLNG